MDKPVLVLSKDQIRQKVTRIAYQLLEDNLKEKEIVLAGIVKSGYIMAERLKDQIESISDIQVSLMMVSLEKHKATPAIETSMPVAYCKNKVVIIVDDVINSGRTLAQTIGVFITTPIKKLRTVTLVSRSYRMFPVSPDFTGLELATVLKENVEVVLGGTDDSIEDAVYLR